ncbi:hypothetical protein [Pontiella sp.]|uniref:hypothetical protein n=1 Tax=Pontiella sp. TaxID=2837462 RepID=UPI0035633CFA
MGNHRDTMEEQGTRSCTGIHELLDWQIVQYRRAIDAHRLDLSKAEGRCVAWHEAEQDFNAHDRRRMAEQSRIEYCGLFCPDRNKCLTALHFLHQKKTEPIYKVG